MMKQKWYYVLSIVVVLMFSCGGGASGTGSGDSSTSASTATASYDADSNTLLMTLPVDVLSATSCDDLSDQNTTLNLGIDRESVVNDIAAEDYCENDVVTLSVQNGSSSTSNLQTQYLSALNNFSIGSVFKIFVYNDGEETDRFEGEVQEDAQDLTSDANQSATDPEQLLEENGYVVDTPFGKARKFHAVVMHDMDRGDEFVPVNVDGKTHYKILEEIQATQLMVVSFYAFTIEADLTEDGSSSNVAYILPASYHYNGVICAQNNYHYEDSDMDGNSESDSTSIEESSGEYSINYRRVDQCSTAQYSESTGYTASSFATADELLDAITDLNQVGLLDSIDDTSLFLSSGTQIAMSLAPRLGDIEWTTQTENCSIVKDTETVVVGTEVDPDTGIETDITEEHSTYEKQCTDSEYVTIVTAPVFETHSGYSINAGELTIGRGFEAYCFANESDYYKMCDVSDLELNFGEHDQPLLAVIKNVSDTFITSKSVSGSSGGSFTDNVTQYQDVLIHIETWASLEDIIQDYAEEFVNSPLSDFDLNSDYDMGGRDNLGDWFENALGVDDLGL
jgi:hypothetical protein